MKGAINKKGRCVSVQNWFANHIRSYNVELDHIIQAIYINLDDIQLPDFVVRPEHFKHLRVSVPTNNTFHTDFEDATVQEVYPNLPRNDRCERLDYLKNLDQMAFSLESLSCHFPPLIHF
jgi:hypothetical protein